MSVHDEEKEIVLVCGNCGHQKRMSESSWLPWKEKRQKYGTVLTHDNALCHGVYVPEDEMHIPKEEA